VKTKKKVLFLCTGNSARSQMAEALLRKHAENQYEVHSAGLEPKGVNPFTIRVLEEHGLDTCKLRSKNMTEYLGVMQFDYLVTVCDNADERCPFIPGTGKQMHWSFEDPAAFSGSEAETLEKFREVRQLIEARILTWLKQEQGGRDAL